MNFKELLKSKTFWTGVSGIIAAAASYFQGAMSVKEAVMTAGGALLAIFLRDGLASAVAKAKE